MYTGLFFTCLNTRSLCAIVLCSVLYIGCLAVQPAMVPSVLKDAPFYFLKHQKLCLLTKKLQLLWTSSTRPPVNTPLLCLCAPPPNSWVVSDTSDRVVVYLWDKKKRRQLPAVTNVQDVPTMTVTVFSYYFRNYWPPHCRLSPPPPRTPTNICINLIPSETRVPGLHFCRW